jgi:hypothetical protein
MFPPKDDFTRETWVEKADKDQRRKQQLQGLLQQQAQRRGPPSKAFNRQIQTLVAKEMHGM